MLELMLYHTPVACHSQCVYSRVCVERRQGEPPVMVKLTRQADCYPDQVPGTDYTYICTYGWVDALYACVHISVYVWMDARMYACMHVCIYMHICICICRYI